MHVKSVFEYCPPAFVLIVVTDWLSLHSHFKLQGMNAKHKEDLQQQLAKFHEVSLGPYQW